MNKFLTILDDKIPKLISIAGGIFIMGILFVEIMLILILTQQIQLFHFGILQ